MIVSKGIIQRLAPSLREATPQQGDGITKIPPNFAFVGLPGEAIRLNTGSNPTTETSVFIPKIIAVANGGLNDQTICTLKQGWWRIHVTGCYFSNYTTAGPGSSGEFFCTIDNVTQAFNFLSLFAVTNTAQQFNFVQDFLLPGDTLLHAVLIGNGVGQSHNVATNWMIQRLL